jgi:hypothetical protein
MAIPQAQILRSKELNSREKELPPLGIIIYNKGNNYDILLKKKNQAKHPNSGGPGVRRLASPKYLECASIPAAVAVVVVEGGGGGRNSLRELNRKDTRASKRQLK